MISLLFYLVTILTVSLSSLSLSQVLAAIAIALNVVYILGILVYRRQSVILAGVPVFLILMCLGVTLLFYF